MLERRIRQLKELSKDERHRDYIFSDITSTDVKFMNLDANSAVHRIYREIELRHNELYREYGKGCHNLVFIDPYGLEFKRESLDRILSSHVRSDIIMLFNSYAVGMQAYNHIQQGYSSEELDTHLGYEWKNYVITKAQEEGKKLIDLSRNELSNILSEYYVEIFKKHDFVVETVRLPLRLRAQQYDLIFACKRTRGENPFLEGVRYIRDLIQSTNYGLIDELKTYITTGKMPGLLEYMIKDPERALEEYKTAKRYRVA